MTDILKSLSQKELSLVKPLTDEQIDKALEQGKHERDLYEAKTYMNYNADYRLLRN